MQPSEPSGRHLSRKRRRSARQRQRPKEPCSMRPLAIQLASRTSRDGPEPKGPRRHYLQPSPLYTRHEAKQRRTGRKRAFRERYYPLPKAMHTDFRITNRLAAPLEIDYKVTAEQVQNVLSKAGQWKAPGPDQLPNGFLKRLGKPLFQALASLAEVCWRIGYYPGAFQKAVTVILRKPGKHQNEYHQAGG